VSVIVPVKCETCDAALQLQVASRPIADLSHTVGPDSIDLMRQLVARGWVILPKEITPGRVPIRCSDCRAADPDDLLFCPDCDHRHQGQALGFICIGCACDKRPPFRKLAL
jgi:hypothetical protein